ncbi:MAG: Holliday junction branch migration protein RuvA [Deltaproteobacteria bacterium]|nr:Holliday junction branch migration protein RuvA [Deltaproteobacteria bacterium]MBW1952981.1 Holliday junction branch migration protein RuvA [Deltaproteobacteria bacterium]MBW1985960.1 Holliday junction branch migration protein RuvA [Deltaproteobacteria bacterium]MBW2133720.1 Holliday junction branch migration protein RuvA [Deltaproteobacteria bacterium]
MIALLEGELVLKSSDQVIIKVAGVGYQVFIPLSTFYLLPEPPAPVALQIHTLMTSETLQLYGFQTLEEKQIFLKLLTIPRVGPRMAINILSGLSPQELSEVLASSDVKRMASIPGVGRRSAERILLELKDKLHPARPPLPRDVLPPQERRFQDALSALLNLGYSKAIAEKALNEVQAQGTASSLEDLLRQGLKRLAP